MSSHVALSTPKTNASMENLVSFVGATGPTLSITVCFILQCLWTYPIPGGFPCIFPNSHRLGYFICLGVETGFVSLYALCSTHATHEKTQKTKPSKDQIIVSAFIHGAIVFCIGTATTLYGIGLDEENFKKHENQMDCDTRILLGFGAIYALFPVIIIIIFLRAHVW